MSLSLINYMTKEMTEYLWQQEKRQGVMIKIDLQIQHTKPANLKYAYRGHHNPLSEGD